MHHVLLVHQDSFAQHSKILHDFYKVFAFNIITDVPCATDPPSLQIFASRIDSIKLVENFLMVENDFLLCARAATAVDCRVVVDSFRHSISAVGCIWQYFSRMCA